MAVVAETCRCSWGVRNILFLLSERYLIGRIPVIPYSYFVYECNIYLILGNLLIVSALFVSHSHLILGGIIFPVVPLLQKDELGFV